jgi:hypothetical protein
MRLSFATGILVVSGITAITATNIASATASSGAKSIEHLRIMSTKAASRRLSVIATGAFTAGGYDKPGRKIDTIVLPGGTFTFKRVSTSFTGTDNPKTCLITETDRGTFTLGGGTGKYAGIQGSGTYVASIVAVPTKNHAGQCKHVQAPHTFQGTTIATGTVRT